MRSAVRVLGFFACLWTIVAIVFARAPWWSYAALLVPAALVILSLTGVLPQRRGTGATRAGRLVAGWSIVEGAAIFAVLNILVALHRPAYSVAAIIAIVGLHFVPLAAGLRLPVYYATAAVLVLVAGGVALNPDAESNATGAAITAVTLVVTSLWLIRLARRPVAAPA